jgi:transposase
VVRSGNNGSILAHIASVNSEVRVTPQHSPKPRPRPVRHALVKGSHGGRPPAFDQVHYRDRNTVERAVNKLRAHRAVATRYDKRDYVYRGTITVAAIWIWLRDPVPDPLRDTP